MREPIPTKYTRYRMKAMFPMIIRIIDLCLRIMFGKFRDSYHPEISSEIVIHYVGL